MNRMELAGVVAGGTGLGVGQAGEAIDVALTAIAEALAAGRR